ncbi:MAG: transglutaminase-like domain-containing protein [Desulfobacterales bacterium]|nr:transglutaminase-like domain-containing protein [Desulfobacterales bacterium]
MKKIIMLWLSLFILLPINDLRAETTIERLVEKIVSQREANDNNVYKIEKWVMRNIKYRSDKKQFNMDERWTLPMETLQRKKGDCEDGSILIMSLAVTAGVPVERLRLYAPIALPNGWHASVAYQRESDDKWVWVEWTVSSVHSQGPIGNRPTLAQGKNFLPIGYFLEVTSLNPFTMKWLKDDELYERAKGIIEASKRK